MNQLITNQPLTMSSRELAEYTGKQHQHIKRDIEKMLIELELDVSKFGRIYKDSMNRSQTEYLLDRDQTDCLLTGYSAKARMKVIKRWKELEGKLEQPSWISQLSPEATIALQDLSNQLTVANEEVDRLQGVCNTITAQFASGMTPSAFSKQLNGVNVQQVNNKLLSMGMLIKTKHGFEPASYSRDRYFKVSYHDYKDSSESDRQRSTVTLTKTGAKWLYRAYLSNKLPMKKTWDGNYVHMIFED